MASSVTVDKHLDAVGIRTRILQSKGSSVPRYRLVYKENYPNRGHDLPENFLKFFLPDKEFFQAMRKPKKDDWLATRSEKGQTFDNFLHSKRMIPSKPREIIYLMPLVFFEDPVPEDVLNSLHQFAQIFFGMTVKIMKTQTLKKKVPHRINEDSESYQVHAGQILKAMSPVTPKDAFCVAGITMCDLYPQESWNFVFGLANLSGRCGVYSLARYLSNFGKYENSRYEPDCEVNEPLLKRACKTMCHEIGHMFGLKHCIFFKCIMNGSNHLDESDSRPIFLCPVCLRKLHFTCKFDIIERYQKMEAFWAEHNLQGDADWLNRRVKHIMQE